MPRPTPSATATETRILLLSDTHGRLHPRILAMADGVEAVVHAGDVGHPDVLAQLADNGRRLVAVRGNNDTPAKWPDSATDGLEGLPRSVELSVAGGVIAVEHGDRVTPVDRRHALLRARHPKARLVLYGHSHRQVIDRGAMPWVVNPGAAGRSRTFSGSGCVLLRIFNGRWYLQPFQFPLDDWRR